jgi:uncharacterized protein YgbK (DUF1537 family)
VPPKYAWYGDDFTGASDTLATLAQAGLRSLLFCGVPTAPQYARAGVLDAVGIAGAARSMDPPAMRGELVRVAPFLAGSGARIIHYKCCSTFDSAPHVGSIGAAVEALRPLAPAHPVFIVGGQPSLGRYCVFGELYAVAQRGGPVFRIDRHPTMSRHPVTPMREADLRVHLAAQGLTDVALVDIRAHEGEGIGKTLTGGERAVLFDVANDAQLAPIGAAMWSRAEAAPLLVVGASSVAQALIDHWGHARQWGAATIAPARSPVFLLAGSLSPVTARQIVAAAAYTRVALAPDRLAGDRAYLHEQVERIAGALRAGESVLAHTTPVGEQHSVSATSTALASASGALLRAVLRAVPLSRIGIAGGDTSSHAVQALTPWGLEWIGQLDAGVALLRARSDDDVVDGVEVMLKGGQMGSEELFDALVHGRAAIEA